MDISEKLKNIASTSVQVAVIAMVATAGLFSHAAQAQVKLESSIKKVQTLVNDAGEVERRLVDAGSVVPGDELQYTVSFTNEGEVPVDAGTIVITTKFRNTPNTWTVPPLVRVPTLNSPLTAKCLPALRIWW